MLRHIDFNLPFILETDASDFAVGAVLLQPEGIGSNLIHPVAFTSRKSTKAERNYSTNDKELLGLIFAFGKWHQYFYGTLFPVQEITDHANLQHFRTRNMLNNRHLNWKLFLQNYDFCLSYRPGSSNVVARVDLMEEERNRKNFECSRLCAIFIIIMMLLFLREFRNNFQDFS